MESPSPGVPNSWLPRRDLYSRRGEHWTRTSDRRPWRRNAPYPRQLRRFGARLRQRCREERLAGDFRHNMGRRPEIPRHVMHGYGVMMGEMLEQLPEGELPTHIFIQAGVGGLPAAAAGYLWLEYDALVTQGRSGRAGKADCHYQECKGRQTHCRDRQA